MPLTAAERRKLVEAPFICVRRLQCSYPWSGTLLDRPVPSFAGTRLANSDDSEATEVYRRKIRGGQALTVNWDGE